ncbi:MULTISPECIES: type I restriction endonuclease subunit R [unclassified Coleofasciculus]|uniref:type I restriction endonuclease subunit R n=1 Tax=unclassified Coleofasciculus TaxID=2692782 RepID=UPI0018826926|nr:MULTISPECIES: type I restriction endonuclease [unclassified Coleofasciculus]MBE9128864.1 type I restriction endonuclease subunit R [Coleofasciculus sp. LEGE 07081]MBE9151624.1 type I restriction endonuclease subunit R [Coleofasciculus sp. LEGE 07092]
MHQEKDFENIIERELLNHYGYHRGNPEEYKKDTALFHNEIINFIQTTQPQQWEKFSRTSPGEAQKTLITSLTKELKSRGMLDVLRNGFKCYGKTFKVAYFQPNTGMNPETIALYSKNRLTVTRQVTIKTGIKKGRKPDITLSLNGLPIATLELKNQLTGQTYRNAIDQYQTERDPKDPLFRFKERCLVHFAVDTDEVWMTTKLAGAKTYFLPFNKGDNHAAGNPPVLGEYRTSYLWQEALQRDSILEILARFLHLETKEIQIPTTTGIKYQTKETLIFPRYHQLDVVRKLIAHTKQHQSGHNYLIQHSAGSGKSNSIAWLAHRLANLHNDQDDKIFDTVIVITDRKVLDRQLQDTIYQFDHKTGVVHKIDENTKQLAKALSAGVPVIISTIQKFPFISQAIQTLEKKGTTVTLTTQDKRFAIIVDEAHSSQSGETATELRKILNKDGIEAAIAHQLLDDEPDDNLSDAAQQELLRAQLTRTKQPNLSYFAFTATPKQRTLLLFDEPGETGQAPFHLYTMRQAIEEGFIKDVLANYTYYERYYELVRLSETNPDLPRRQAAREIARFVELHPHNIAQKVEIIIEHFRNHTRHKIGGRAKAMVVTRSREHAVKYKLAFDQYIKDKGYTDIKSLVAFSGSLSLDDFPNETFTEVSMNGGIKSGEIPEKFASDAYQVLLVANKFQTGFDQPLLHTLFVDKRLAGVQAVQTLSRLNRTTPGKEDTFVLDFVNQPEDIYKAFKPYYEETPVGQTSDPQQLNDLAFQLYEWRLFHEENVNEWCDIWFRPKTSLTGGEHKKLNSLLDPVVDRYKALEEAEREQFRSQLTSFRNLYLFLAQILPYQDSDLEKLYAYGRFLLKKLPRSANAPQVDLSGDIEMKFYRLEKISEGKIDLKEGEAEPLKGATATGTRQPDKNVPLSQLIDSLNERFGTDFTLADQLFFEQITESAIANDNLKQAALVNTKENFAPVLDQQLENLFLERIEGNEQIFTEVMNNQEFKQVVFEKLLESIYEQLNSPSGASFR